MIGYCSLYIVTFHSELFNSYGDVTVRGESCKFRPRLVLTAFECGEIFIVSHLLWHGTLVFEVSSKRPLHLVALYDCQSHWIPILTRIPTGPLYLQVDNFIDTGNFYKLQIRYFFFFYYTRICILIITEHSHNEDSTCFTNPQTLHFLR